MAGSFQNINCGEVLVLARMALQSGTVKNASVSAGRRFSAGAMAARDETVKASDAVNAAQKNGRRIFDDIKLLFRVMDNQNEQTAHSWMKGCVKKK
jgi:hypothetical protein